MVDTEINADFVKKSKLVQMPAGFDLRALPVVGSTNDIAREIVMGDTPVTSPIVVWSGEQTGGRGRRGRGWASPPGNLYSSILIPDVGDLATAAQLSFVTAISMRAALSKLIPLQNVKCKWPNDILVDGAKICGILLECGVDKFQKNWVVIGSGVNVTFHPKDTPYPVTKVQKYLPSIDTATVLGAYLEEFARRYQIWRVSGFSDIREEWLQNCYGLGRAIVARLANNHEEHGRFLDLDADGSLILERDDLSRITVTAGDVFVKEAL